jgi:multidrug efflux pump
MREAMLIPITPPAIPGLGTQGGFEMWLQNRGRGDPEQLQQTVQAFMAKASQRPELTGLNTTFNSASRQLHLDVDRARAETLGVPVADVYSTVQTLFGSLYVSQFNQYSRVWQVILQAEPEYRRAPNDIQNIYVRGRDNQMVPLSSIVSYHFASGPQNLPRFNAFTAASIRGQAAPGYSSGQALDAMEEVAQQTLSEDYGFAWAGLAYEERQAGFASTLVFVIGIIMVFLILAAQYNAWGLPLSVISAVPFGVFGALVAVWLRGIENDIYFQIGLVTLIGLAAKNAILIVEFAVMKRESGMSIEESALEAARLRLRPIVMTSLAFILGALPLAIASGAGANSRHAIGTGIIGGMVAATTLALFFVPLFYVRIESARERLFPSAREVATHSRGEATEEPDPAGHDAPQKDG